MSEQEAMDANAAAMDAPPAMTQPEFEAKLEEAHLANEALLKRLERLEALESRVNNPERRTRTGTSSPGPIPEGDAKADQSAISSAGAMADAANRLRTTKRKELQNQQNAAIKSTCKNEVDLIFTESWSGDQAKASLRVRSVADLAMAFWQSQCST